MVIGVSQNFFLTRIEFQRSPVDLIGLIDTMIPVNERYRIASDSRQWMNQEARKRDWAVRSDIAPDTFRCFNQQLEFLRLLILA